MIRLEPKKPSFNTKPNQRIISTGRMDTIGNPNVWTWANWTNWRCSIGLDWPNTSALVENPKIWSIRTDRIVSVRLIGSFPKIWVFYGVRLSGRTDLFARAGGRLWLGCPPDCHEWVSGSGDFSLRSSQENSLTTPLIYTTKHELSFFPSKPNFNAVKLHQNLIKN